MKRRSTLLIAAAAVGCVLLVAWWLRPSRKTAIVSTAPLTEDTATTIDSSAPPAPSVTRDEDRRPREERATAIFQAIEGSNVPINFRGRAVDQDEHPLQDVNVRYTYSTETGNLLGIAWGQQKIYKGEATTDAGGTFSIGGIRGHTLTIESLTKEGYQYVPRAAKVYNFYGSTAAGKFTPDLSNPVLFVMLNRTTAEPLVSHGGSFGKTMRLPGNGTPVRWNVWKGQADPNGELQVTLKREPAVLARVGQPVTWATKVEMIGGGIVEASSNELIYRAPEEGYASVIDYPKAEQRRGVPARSFYIKTADGKYGRIELNLYADDEGPTARCLIKSHMNPGGSQTLENNE